MLHDPSRRRLESQECVTMPDPILHNLDTRPTASDAYLWCDYVELRCLSSVDHRFSRGNLLEILDETVDLAPADPAADDDSADPDFISDEIGIADADADAEEGTSAGTPSSSAPR